LVARALIGLGLAPGERVCLLGSNRPEWVEMDLGIMAAGGVPAGIYTTHTPPSIGYILRHSKARFLLIEGPRLWSRLERVGAAFLSEAVEHIIMMPATELPGPASAGPRLERLRDPRLLTWERFLAHGDDVPPSRVDARVR
jgi:long-chain acyl-CoA synthetase